MSHLALMLDAPLQSWGFASRFQRRTTGLQPTKSGVVGLLCAALGAAKGSPAEREWLPKLAGLRMTVVTIPRRTVPASNRTQPEELPLRRLEDFHTVLDTRRASGAPNRDPVVTHRQYLLDALFGVLLTGETEVLKRAADALRDPIWGVWFGRKCCLPAAPLYRAGPCDEGAAWHGLIGDAPRGQSSLVEEGRRFADRRDSRQDQPLSFGTADSSGPEGRRFTPRRIRLVSKSQMVNRKS